MVSRWTIVGFLRVRLLLGSIDVDFRFPGHKKTSSNDVNVRLCGFHSRGFGFHACVVGKCLLRIHLGFVPR
jgi:hypothetical protein